MATENHGLATPAAGSGDWHIPLNQNFETLDTGIEIRDLEANRTAYAPKLGAKYQSIDPPYRVYLGDGDQWLPAGRLQDDGDVLVAGGQSIQDAVDAAGAAAPIVITSSYDESVETFPVQIPEPGTTIRGGRRGAGSAATIINDQGTHTFVLNAGNERSPGITLRDLNIIQTAGGSGVRVEHAKFNYFENVDVDANGVGSDDAWHFGNATDSFQNNSQILVSCSAEQAGRDGFAFGNLCHHVSMFGCTALDCTRMGVYVNGPFSFKFLAGQLEDNGEPGLRSRVADAVLVGSNTYLEGNATVGNLNNSEIAFIQTPNARLEQAWANPKPTGTANVVEFGAGSHGGSVRHVEASDGYGQLAFVQAADVELHRASHLIPSGTQYALVAPAAARVRDAGVIVGAGTDNGGNNDLRGINTSAVSGAFPNDAAIADGTTIPPWTPVRWTGASWIAPAARV